MSKQQALGVLLGAIALTLLALVAYDWLPERRLSALPSPEGPRFYNPYGDAQEGGPSHSEMVGDEFEHLWRCRVTSQAPFAYCGLNIFMSEHGDQEGVDLSGYHTLRLRLVQKEPKKRLHVFVRHYDQDYAREGDGDSAQFSAFDLYPRDLEQPFDVNLQELSLADWWVAGRELPRRLRRPVYGNVIVVGLGYLENLSPGDYTVELETFEFVGDWVSRAQWYFMIILAWLLGLSLLAGQRLLAMARVSQLNRRRIQTLTERNQQLRAETDVYKAMSTLDALTGAYNRYGFEQQWSQLAHDPSKSPLALILMDIDYFKRFNDTYGHDMGDEVLKKIVRVLESNTRSADVLGRWGGEEFLLLCPQTSLDCALQLAEKIRAIVASTPASDQIEDRLTLSLSVAEIQPEESFVDAFARADRALYDAKGKGRNRVITALGACSLY